MCAEITQKDIHDLLEIFERKPYESGTSEFGSTDDNIIKVCEYLFQMDYNLIELDNINGNLSTRYPSRIFIPEIEHKNGVTPLVSGNGVGVGPTNVYNSIHSFVTFANSVIGHQNVIYEDTNEGGKIRDLITMAKYARCRQRFVVPVMIYKGKYICRSATISVMPETYGRKVYDYAYDCFNGGANTSIDENNSTSSSPTNNISTDQQSSTSDESLINNASPFSYDEVIKSDIQLLNALNVGTIVDLMVENRKVKYFVTVSSSEKADPENHYANFNLLSLPYPGCEFFSKFRDNNYMAKNLQYNWKQSFNDANLSMPKCGPAYDMDVNWYDYKKWDLVQITQNYLKATLKYIQEENTGLLIHCISGWDRTPLFISLVRLSLWADGLIHKSLNAIQMTYLTLAYDWYLFGHQLPDRLKRGEDILFFCFHVLKYLTEDEFSLVEHRKRTKTTSSSGSGGSSVIVLKPSDVCGDDDSIKDSDDLDYILNIDQDSNDSFSNISNCDMSLTDNFYTNNITSRSPNPKRSKTSPISVPRQRHESTSSNGSWQVVTDTGSIDSIMNNSYMMRVIHQEQNGSGISGGVGNGHNSGSSCSSNATAKDIKNLPSMRKQRLNAVRAIFIQAYGKTIGLKFKEGSAMTLTTFIGTIAEQLF